MCIHAITTRTYLFRDSEAVKHVLESPSQVLTGVRLCKLNRIEEEAQQFSLMLQVHRKHDDHLVVGQSPRVCGEAQVSIIVLLMVLILMSSHVEIMTTHL